MQHGRLFDHLPVLVRPKGKQQGVAARELKARVLDAQLHYVLDGFAVCLMVVESAPEGDLLCAQAGAAELLLSSCFTRCTVLSGRVMVTLLMFVWQEM